MSTTPIDIDISRITEAHVAAWMLQQTRDIGLPKAELTCYTAECYEYAPDFKLVPGVRWMAKCAATTEVHCGDTLAEAVKLMRAEVKSPAQQAEAKRIAAHKLLEEAHKLEADAAETEAVEGFKIDKDGIHSLRAEVVAQ